MRTVLCAVGDGDSARSALATSYLIASRGDGHIEAFYPGMGSPMIITGGFNVYPTEVEDVLFTHPAVLEAVVIGVPDQYRGEAVKAFIVVKPGVTATVEELLGFCKTNLAKYKVPSVIEIVESLPKSAVGKVLRRELRELEANKEN